MIGFTNNSASPSMIHGVTRREMKNAFKTSYMGGPAYSLTGTTRDSTATLLGNCVVDLFYSGTDILAAKTTSDSNGAFSFSIGPSLNLYIVAYKAGSPDVAGASINTLRASLPGEDLLDVSFVLDTSTLANN